METTNGNRTSRCRRMFLPVRRVLSLSRWLLQFRRSEAAISLGDYEQAWHDDGVLAYVRTDGRRRFLVAANFGGDDVSLPLDVAERGTVVVSTGISRVGSQVSRLIDLAAHEGVIVALPPVRDDIGR